MECVKLGIIGIGTMGSVHAQSIMEGKIARCKLTVVCDPKREPLKRFSSADPFHFSRRFAALASDGCSPDCHSSRHDRWIFGMPARVRPASRLGEVM